MARSAPPVAELVAQFLAAKRPRLAAGSYENYRYALGTHFAAGFGGRPPHSLAAAEVEA